MTDLKRSQININLRFEHQVANRTGWRNNLPILTIKQCLSFLNLLIDLGVNQIEIQSGGDVFVERQLEQMVFIGFEGRNDFGLLVVDEIDQVCDAEVQQLLLAVRRVDV